MKLDLVLKLRTECVIRIRDYYSYAMFYHPTLTEMNDCISEIKLECMEKMPKWAREYVNGYEQALRDDLFRRCEIVHGAMIEGIFYSTWSNRDDYYEKRGLTAQQFSMLTRPNTGIKTGLYWSGSLKPFFISENKESSK